MCIVVPPPRLASASVVFFGRRGEITQHAQDRGVSRQRLYREADSVLLALDDKPYQQQIACLQQQLLDLHNDRQQLLANLSQAVLIDADRQAEFSSTAQAEGVSLPVARRLLAVFLRNKTPSVAQLGRFTHQSGLRAGRLLAVFDEHARAAVTKSFSHESLFL